MEELNKDSVIENTTTNSMLENNHVTQDSEPAFSDEEEEAPLRLNIRNIYYVIESRV